MRRSEAFYFFSQGYVKVEQRARQHHKSDVVFFNTLVNPLLTAANFAAYCSIMMQFFGTYGGFICGFGGFLTAIAALLYARARVAEFEQSVRDLDWQQVSELSLDVAKLKKAAQKWQNNANAQEKVSQKDLLERAYMERLMQQNSNVQQIRKVDM